MPVAIEARSSYQPAQLERNDKSSFIRQRYGEKAGEKQSYLRTKDRKVVGSEAFNLEYDTPPTRDDLRAEIVSYLGEYRLQVQKYDYTLVFGRDKHGRGPIEIRDIGRGEESMHRKTKKAIESNELLGKSTRREEAEEIGLSLLNDRLRSAQTGDTVVWASPPGPKDEGYGDYGFLYVGKVTKLGNGEAMLAMTAIRVENPRDEKKEHDGGKTDDQKKKELWTKRFHNVVSTLTGDTTPHASAEDFIARPLVIRDQLSEQQIHKVLDQDFSFEADKEEKKKFASIINQMDPLIEEFLDVMESGNKNEKLKNFYKLENYALKLKEEYDKGEKVVYRGPSRLVDFKNDEKPEEVGGSCGSSGGGFLSNALMSASMGGETGSGEKHILKCRCPLCGADVNAVIANGKITCPSCKGSAEYKC